MLITTKHLRAVGYCLSGSRRFCTKHGIDWRRLVREGVPEEHLLRTGDAMAIKVVERAHGQEKQ